MKRYLTAALILAGVVVAMWPAGRLTATPTTVVVSPGHMNGWAIVDDNGAGAGSGSLVSGPAAPPAGVGSARLQLSSSSAGWMFAAPYAATPLSSFSALSYSTYRASLDAGNNQAISLQFNVDYDLTDAYTGYQGRIVFEPYQTFPGGVPQGTWQTWNALAGKWWQTANPSNPARAPYVGNVQQAGPLPCPQSAPCTIATLTAAYPNMGVHATLGAVVLKAGSGWSAFDGNVDNLTIGVGASTTVYDFEGDCTTDCYVRPDGNDANTGLADTASQAKKTVQAAVNQVSVGGTVHVGAGTYVEQVSIGKQITLDGAGAGSTTIQAPATLATMFTTSAANKPVVYVSASGGTISHLTVDGNGVANANYRMEGIAFYNAGGAVSNTSIVHVRETPLSGNQQGVALYANNADAVARTLNVTNNTISDYQKNGMALNGAGLTATVSGNVVTGAGPFSGQAQNGIQIGFGAVGSITGNTVSGNDCTVIADCTADPTSATNADGAAGILLYTPGTAAITVQNNTLSGNQFGVWTVGATSINVDGNTIAGVGGTGVAVWDCDQWCGPTDAVGTTGTITNNTMTGQSRGLIQRDFVAGAPVPAVVAHNNSISGSSAFGAWSNVALNASDNWWGSASGPKHASNTFNVLLQGDRVSDNVTFVTWLNAAPPAGVSFAPVTTTSPVGKYSSIQAGVNASASGGTVNAAAGTFTENVVVGNQVTLAGAGQANTFVIPAVSNPNCGGAGGGSLCAGGSNVVLVQANNVTVHDLAVDGNNPSISSGVSAGGSDLDARNGIITNHALGVYNNLTVHHVTVRNVYLRGMYASSGGTFNFHDDTVQNVQAEYASIAMFNFGGSGVFANNTVSGANDAISSNWSTGTQYLNNTITGSGSGVHTDNNGGSGGVADLIQGNNVSACKIDGYGVWTFAAYRNQTVTQNTVTGCAVGLAAAGQQAPVTTTFTDNTVDGAGATMSSGGSTGAFITTDLFGYGTSNVSAVLTGNIIKNSGVGIDADAEKTSLGTFTATINASKNAIFANGAGVALSDVSTPPTVSLGMGNFVFNMTPNWWGDASGPANATSNPAGTGNSVADGVVYSPWLGIGIDASGAPGFQLASPMTWVAGPAVCGATCIQAAIDDAANGDTVKAKSGVFHEHVIVNKPITLTAGSSPIIDGGGSGAGITVTVPNATVSSFEVRNVTNGIVVAAGANNATVSSNNLHNFTSAGLRASGVTGLSLATNTVNGGHAGSCVGGFWGIQVQNVSGAIDGNTVSGIGNGLTTGCQEGRAIEADGAGTVNITNNVVGTYQKSGIIVRDTVNSTISGNTTAGEGPTAAIAQNGITVTSTGTATISGNHTSGHAYTPATVVSCGILTFNAATISGNDSTHDQDGLCIAGGSGTQATNNTVTGHLQQGILVDGAASVLVDHNTVDGQGNGTTASPGTSPDTDTRYYGVFAVDSTGTISNNVIKGIKHGVGSGVQSGVGIRLAARSGASANMTISGNTLSDIQKGAIVVTNPYGGTAVNASVLGNTVTGNGPISYIAQNGIQISYGATAGVADNIVSGYDYAPSTWAAADILLYQAGTTVVAHNTMQNGQEGLIAQTTNNASVTGNTFSGIRDTAIIIWLGSSNGTYAGNVETGMSSSMGVYISDNSTNNAFTGNQFRSNDVGVAVDYQWSGAPTGNTFNTNCIIGNTTAGMETLGTQVGGKVNAQGNWWGSFTGANPPGTGDKIISPATIDASLPQLNAVAGCPVIADSDGDGYTDAEEIAIGKDPYTYCGIMRADVNMDGKVTLADLIIVSGHYRDTVPPASSRLDQNVPLDNKINLSDLIIMIPYYNKSVTLCP